MPRHPSPKPGTVNNELFLVLARCEIVETAYAVPCERHSISVEAGESEGIVFVVILPLIVENADGNPLSKSHRFIVVAPPVHACHIAPDGNVGRDFI